METRGPAAPPAGRIETRLAADARLSIDELAEAVGIRVEWVVRLERLGVVEPVAPGAEQFAAAEAPRLRRVLRLWRDLGVNLAGAAIIVELVERLERLEAELERRRAR